MTPATYDSEKVRFHTLNKDTGNRVVSQYVDSVTGKPVDDEHEAKGYERGENDYVLLTDEDLDSVELETVRTIDIEKFVPRGSIEWIYLETPYYLTANDKMGDEAFRGHTASYGGRGCRRHISRCPQSSGTGGRAGGARRRHRRLDPSLRR